MRSKQPRSQARLSGIGTFVPAKVVTNDDISKLVDTSEEWIVQRSGIHERRYAGEDEFTSDLCVQAAENLRAQPGISFDEVDFILAGTTTPDLALPSVACIVQKRLGLPSTARAMDLNATCAGFVYALSLADSLVTSGQARKVFICLGETLSKVMDFTDRTTCVLFGDGAAAALIERTDDSPSFYGHVGGTHGAGGLHLYRTGLACSLFGEDLIDSGKVVQNGREVFRWAVQTVSDGIPVLLEHCGLSADDIDWFVPHSANIRILEALCQRTGIGTEKLLESLSYCGNTSAASIPLAIDKARREGKLSLGDKLLLYGFGGGLVHGGTIVTWGGH